jgi:DNA modification methylase
MRPRPRPGGLFTSLLDAVRVPYKTTESEIDRRKLDANGRRNTEAGFGRNRTGTYAYGGADPGNVVNVPQSYNQHYGVAHTAAMPEGLASFFIQATSPPGGIVIDPFTGGGTTTVMARRLGRRAGGLEIHQDYASTAQHRVAADQAADIPGRLAEVG